MADNDEICRFNDGNVRLYWYPREEDDAGDIPYKEFLDDSTDFDEVNPTNVPRELAEEIASERLPYYRPRSFWTGAANAMQLGMILSLGLIILAIGELVSNSLGLSEGEAGVVLQVGFGIAVLATVLYAVAVLLDVLAGKGYIDKSPLSSFDIRSRR